MMQAHIEEFIHFVAVEKGYSPHTVAAYRSDLDQFLLYLVDEDVSDWQEVGRSYIERYVQYLVGRTYASSTVSRKIAAVKSFFHFLVAEGVVKDTPTRAVDSPPVKRHIPHPLSPEEVARLLNAPSQASNTPRALRDRALLELMYATGMRVSEVISLDVDALDLEDGSVRCVGKGDKERIIPLHEYACDVLRIYLEKGRGRFLRDPGERALFLSHLGLPLTRQGLWLLVKEYAAEAGITKNVTPHTLRHSFATHLLDGGAGLREVQKLLGHTSIASTQVYTEISTRRKRQVYDKSHPRA